MKTLREIHKNKKLDIPYPRLENKVKKLMDKYPMHIKELDNEYVIETDIIPLVIEGIDRKSVFNKPDHFQWEKIKKDYLENKLTYKEVKDKYNLNPKDVSQNLKGVREEWKKKLEEEEKYYRDIIWDKKGIEEKLNDKYMNDSDRGTINHLRRKSRIRSGNYLKRESGDKW